MKIIGCDFHPSPAWACGPPIKMKICPVSVYPHLAWTAKVEKTLDKPRPYSESDLERAC